MRSLKTRGTFSVGRKIIFSLALFVLVFAAASILKIQAAGNVTGWLWGGGAESDGAIPYDGTNTNVGWISANSLNCDANNDGKSDGAPAGCPVAGTSISNYGINIPSSDGPITGTNNYAWSENIGWVSFNAGDLTGCPSGACNARRDSGFLKGWARIISIKDALAENNSGGWQGWVSLNGVSFSGDPYGVQISEMDGTGNSPTYAWSGEEEGQGLGWIDFSRARVAALPYIELTPESFSLGGQPQILRAQIHERDPAGQTITFAKSEANPDKFNLSADSCAVNASGWCEINVTAADRSADYTVTITASSPGFIEDSSDGEIIPLLGCAISCPSSVEVMAGSAKNYDVSFGGDSGCALDSCSRISGSSDISASRLDGDTCRVTAAGTARYGSAVSRAISGAGQCDTAVYIKGPGWIETNP